MLVLVALDVSSELERCRCFVSMDGLALHVVLLVPIITKGRLNTFGLSALDCFIPLKLLRPNQPGKGHSEYRNRFEIVLACYGL